MKSNSNTAAPPWVSKVTLTFVFVFFFFTKTNELRGINELNPTLTELHLAIKAKKNFRTANKGIGTQVTTFPVLVQSFHAFYNKRGAPPRSMKDAKWFSSFT